MQPPAEWVKPAVLDVTPSKLAKDAPTAVLLRDYQVRFQPQGTAFYCEIATKAQNAQGLEAIGSVSLSWDPAIQHLIIHKLKVLRDGKEIDYLAQGPGFLTLRRETKLEAATLDGTLTAATQLEGLEVGDIVDVAYTIENADPIMKGHVQADFGLNLGPVRRSRLRFTWPSSMKVAWRSLSHAPDLTIRTDGDWTEATLDRLDPVDPSPPKGAPQRYLRGPELQLGNFSGWSDVSALLSKEFAEAEALAPASPLREEAKSIAARYPDAKSRAEAALALVQDKIRYVLLALDGGGLMPASVDLTWSRRFADCKGKTVVLLALLRELGIEAEPALVSVAAGDGLDQRLPLLSAFDHVLVRATIDGKVYWLDGTRTGDQSLDTIRTPPFYWALPIRPDGAALIRLEPQDFGVPATEVALTLDASAGLSAPATAHGEMLFRGDAALFIKATLDNLAPTARDAGLKDYWRQRYGFVEVSTARATFDALRQEERLVMDGTATLDWSGEGYEADGIRFWKWDGRREPGPDAQTAPYAVAFPFFERESETILLPNKGNGFTIVGQDVDEQVGGYHLLNRAIIAKGAFTIEGEIHSVSTELPAAEADAVANRMAELSKRSVHVKPPWEASTPAERDAIIASTPVTADQYIRRGWALVENRRYDEAIADLDKAINLAPDSARAYSDRALAWAWKKNAEKASADADEALKLDPRDVAALHARGLAAGWRSHWEDAVKAFSEALIIQPEDIFALTWRATAYQKLLDWPDSLRDCETGLKIDSRNSALLECKAYILNRTDRHDEAAAVAKDLLALDPDDPGLMTRSARILHQAGKDDEARPLIDSAISLSPTVMAFDLRIAIRPFSDTEGRIADANQAAVLANRSKDSLTMLARVNYEARKYEPALQVENEVLGRFPDDVHVRAFVGVLEHALGHDAEASVMFDGARQMAGANAGYLNDLCWMAATSNFGLTDALSDCDSALRVQPGNAAFLDSRAFVKLRLGRDQEAKADYDAALATRETSAASLMGRSIAETRLGQAEAAARDRADAIRKSARVADLFRFYGLID
jgi:tetratricopeptide (TPR) repeat protein